MKKIIIVLCLAFITFINFQKVYAREFLEEQDNNYLRHINIEDKDDIAGESIRKLFNKIQMKMEIFILIYRLTINLFWVVITIKQIHQLLPNN